MNQNLPIVTYPALQLLLLSRLRRVIYLQSDVFQLPVSSLPQEAVFSPLDLGECCRGSALHRVRDATKVAYSSAIAYKLAKVSGISAVQWAAGIADQFQSVEMTRNLWGTKLLIDTASNPRDFTVKVVPPAQLYFELTNFGLASWFEFLFHTPLEDDFETHPPLVGDRVFNATSGNLSGLEERDLHNLFLSQYAYARCCSLLRLAQAHDLGGEQALKLRALQTDSVAIAAPPIPWLTAQGEWQLTHPTEQRLIAELVTVLDTLADWTTAETPTLQEPASLLALVTPLAEVFLAFHSACRFWGEIQKTAGDLVKARLGLVAILRSLLGFLLKKRLGVVAPAEL